MTEITTKGGALQGLRVVECATVVAGPLCGRLFGDFGAEVIHVEHPKKGDPLRDFGFTIDGINPWWKYYDRNKKLITLDISKPRGREILFDMLKDADIFIENFRPGRLEAWNIHYDDLAKINPRLIMIRVTGYGQTGPYSSQPGFGTIAEAMSGFAEMTGEPNGPPTLPQFPLADTCAGFYATMAAMFAIYNRDIVGTGKGQVIDVSIWESLFSILGPNALVNHVTGRSPRRIGNRAPTSAPRNTYKTKDDRWITIASATQTTAIRMFELMGMPDLVKDPRFNSNSNRVKNVDALDELVSAWTTTHTRDELSKVLHAAEVPFGPINNVADIMADAHAQAREMIIEHVDVDGRKLRMEGVFPKMSATPGRVNRVGGALGADNDDVFGKLGLTKEQLAELSKNGII
jgi:crotonobetainyl-CoA:carnitine CoA-transferase CaiB-like acyl-CoA transferase